MPCRGIVVEGEDGDRGLADREGGRRDDRRQQPLEPLSRLGQLGRYPRAGRMDLGADMVGNEPHDALALGGRQSLLRLDQAGRQPVDPEPPIGIEHHLDDRRIFEPIRDGGPERGAQHACAARDRLCLEGMDRHRHPGPGPRAAVIERGRLEKEERAVRNKNRGIVVLWRRKA
jgi:hypothetical protein